ncbi:hypothetical protein GOV09_04655 [Candidatus Woesearchaeota archaeon]|nr:hypothetical protein [Candidatus Woesearchaeota archaeon]
MGIFYDAFQEMRKNAKGLFLPAIVDLGFFIVFGFFVLPLRDGIYNNLLQIGDRFITAATELSEFTLTTMPEFKSMVLLISIAVIFTYILYSSIHGYLWAYCLQLGKKKDYSAIKRFFKLNIFWMILFLVYVAISFLFTYVDQLNQRFEPNAFPLGWIAHILLFIILYFAFLSYAIEKKAIRKSFSLVLKGWPLLVAMIGFIIAYILIGSLISLSYPLFIITGIIIIPSAMIYIRLVARGVSHV